MNSYFASVEQQANPFLRGKPIAVTGKRKERSVVAAASVEAKRLGVKTGMATWQAQRICPPLILVMGDPEKYAWVTQTFNAIFQSVADAVERFSVDESFLDVTNAARDTLGAIAIAQTIKTRLREDCGKYITASIGIGPNKLIAKAASEREKPDGLTIVDCQDVLSFLDGLSLTDICGIGPHTAETLEAMGIKTFARLRTYPIKELIKVFHSYGFWLHRAAHGWDDNPVCPNNPEPKSIGHSYTLPKDTYDYETVRRYLFALCEQVSWRLRRDGYQATSIHAFIRSKNFSVASRSRQLREPTNDGATLLRIVWALIQSDLSRQSGIRQVGVSASGLEHGTPAPSLSPIEQKHARLLPALDRLRTRFGSSAWTRASLLSLHLQERSSGFAYDHEL